MRTLRRVTDWRSWNCAARKGQRKKNNPVAVRTTSQPARRNTFLRWGETQMSSSRGAKIGVLILGLLTGGSAVFPKAQLGFTFTPHEKAYYADSGFTAFVRPGFVIIIVSAQIASDGTMSVHYKLTDPAGVPLDQSGVFTAGPITLSFLAAYIPKSQEQYTSYIARIATAPSGATATQAAADSGGSTQTICKGEYIYTYGRKAPPNFDSTATHRFGIYGSRNLTEFDLGTNYADTTYDFVPAGGTPMPRDVVRNPDCDQCHGLPNGMTNSTGSAGLAAHGGSRRSVQLCIICHQPQTSDPDTENSLDMKVFIHKIHSGSSLPSVQAGTPYQIIGFQNSVNDFSTVVYPADTRRCETCHNPKNGATQSKIWLTNPTAAACGSCHDNVNFANGANHPGGPEPNDSLCAGCHIPQGEVEFDASILGSHTIPDQSTLIPGLNFTLVQVANGSAGNKPTVTFTVRDNSGNGIPLSAFKIGSGALSLSMAGPTKDYGYTSFGSDVTTPGYVTEGVANSSSCLTDGTCMYTFNHAVPANATGTYAIGIEGRLTIALLPGTPSQMNTNYGGHNQVIYFSVDGSPVEPRRTVVAVSNCNNCHALLEQHGSLRNNTEYCVFCHNPSDTDSAVRAMAADPADKTAPPQGINFALMVHKIHTGLNLQEQFGQDYVVVGFGGSHNSFGREFASVPPSIPNTGVRFPAMGPTGAVQDTAQCYLCHTNGSEAVLPIGKNPVVDPQGLLNPAPATTSACTACHLSMSAIAHAAVNTDPRFGESCDVCHGTGAAFDATKVHAGQ
jgi:OmcA/MtrC family decaheme c-type cytochrome